MSLFFKSVPKHIWDVGLLAVGSHLSLLAGFSSAGSQTPPSDPLTEGYWKVRGHILDCKVTMDDYSTPLGSVA